jgi:hypothetical protein
MLLDPDRIQDSQINADPDHTEINIFMKRLGQGHLHPLLVNPETNMSLLGIETGRSASRRAL